MTPLLLIVFISLVIVPNVTSYKYTGIDRNANYEMLKDRSWINLWDVINEWQWMHLQNDFNRRGTYQTPFADAPAPKIQFPFRPSIIDPRTVDQPLPPTTIVDKNPLIIKHPFRASIIDPRTVNHPSKATHIIEQPTPGINYPFPVDFVDPRATLFANEPAPVIKYPFRIGIVDPRTVNVQSSSSPNRADERAPIIKYRF